MLVAGVLVWAVPVADNLVVAMIAIAAFALGIQQKMNCWPPALSLLIGGWIGAGFFADRGDGDGLWVLMFPFLAFWWLVAVGAAAVVRPVLAQRGAQSE